MPSPLAAVADVRLIICLSALLHSHAVPLSLLLNSAHNLYWTPSGVSRLCDSTRQPRNTAKT
jgi:hypothetical protein